MDYKFDWNCVSSGGPCVTISELTISFNQSAAAMLNTPEEVAIGFDKEKLIIGITDVKNVTTSKSYKFAGKQNNGWIRIGCKDFIRFLSKLSGKSFSPAKRFYPRMDEDGRVMIISINEEEEED